MASVSLKEFLRKLPDEDAREAFATKCGTSAGYMKLVAYGHKPCSPKLAINIERESARKVLCESLCDEVDWAFIRGTAKRRQADKVATA